MHCELLLANIVSQMNSISFDIVIPLGPNEVPRFPRQIKYVKENVIGYRNIYVVTARSDVYISGCIIVDERTFPFMNFIKTQFGNRIRNGWYFQQLIKLYAGKLIDGILDHYLVIDADVFFLKPTAFIGDDNKIILSTGNEYHAPYFKHMSALHNTFSRQSSKSGICHHMMFFNKYISEIFSIVETEHNEPFWVKFVKSVADIDGSGASEYEIYFHYLVKNHPNEIIIRDLVWHNISNAQFNKMTPASLGPNCTFVSVCAWMG